jgi:hypothetical protein
MTIMIKNMFFVLLSMWFMSCSSHRYILFEHIGAIDKPIRCIVIAKESKLGKQFCELQEEYISEAENFKQLERYVLSNNTKLNDTGTTNSFGTFKVLMDDETLYIIKGQQNSIMYFTDLIAELSSNGNLKLAEILEKNILIRLKGL